MIEKELTSDITHPDSPPSLLLGLYAPSLLLGLLQFFLPQVAPNIPEWPNDVRMPPPS